MNRIRPKQPRLRLDPESYEQLCEEVLQRDSWRCEACGTTSNLEVHHQQHRSQSGEPLCIFMCITPSGQKSSRKSSAILPKSPLWFTSLRSIL